MKYNFLWRVEFFHDDLEHEVSIEAESYKDCVLLVKEVLKIYPDIDFKFVPFIKEVKE